MKQKQPQTKKGRYKDMMKHEFEEIAKRTVTDDQYKMIESLYMESSLDKYEFVKSIKGMLKSISEDTKEEKVIIGVRQMPNGTWMTYEAQLINIDINRGKYEVKRLSNNRCWAETNYDIHYTKVKEVA